MSSTSELNKRKDVLYFTRMHIWLFTLTIVVVIQVFFTVWFYNKLICSDNCIELCDDETYINVLITGFGAIIGFSIIVVYSLFNAFVGDNKVKLKKLIRKSEKRFDRKVDESNADLDFKSEKAGSATWEQFDLFIIVNPYIDYLTKMSSVSRLMNKKDKGEEIEVSIRSALNSYAEECEKKGETSIFYEKLKDLVSRW